MTLVARLIDAAARRVYDGPECPSLDDREHRHRGPFPAECVPARCTRLAAAPHDIRTAGPAVHGPAPRAAVRTHRTER